MIKVLWISAGAVVGALGRYFISGAVQSVASGGFPLGTLAVNLCGSFLAGFFWGVSEGAVIPVNIRLFFFIGVFGSFTTFSTFSLENFHLLRDSEYFLFTINTVVSLLAGVICVFAGYFLSRVLY